jgi:dienelactone hydrolase
LVVFSHSSGGGRRQSTFLCMHLASHGYVVAALDHSEVVATELARGADETAEQTAARQRAWMANRVPDVCFLLDHLLRDLPDPNWNLDAARVGIVGHSFGGWTALAAPDVEPRIRSVVALAPVGGANPKPGILPARLTFDWDRDLPTLYLVAEDDVSLPLAGELAWLPREMRPIDALCTGEHAELFVRGMTLCHLDATIREHQRAREILGDDLQAQLARRGVAVVVHPPGHPA